MHRSVTPTYSSSASGSSGSVVAERLSADPQCRVTVVEAGPGPDTSGVAALTGNGLQLPIGAGSPVVTRFETVLTDRPARTMSLVRGATVGGSGAVNGGYFCRALPSDLDEWGLDGWAWSDLLPHFRAVETDLDFPDAPAHGGRGPIRVRRANEILGTTAHLVESAARAGYPWLDDLNDGSSAALPTGIGLVPSNIVDGVRAGSGAAFLVPATARRNLAVLPGTRAVPGGVRRSAGHRRPGVRAGRPAGAHRRPDRAVRRRDRQRAPADALRHRRRADAAPGRRAGRRTRAGRAADRRPSGVGAADGLADGPVPAGPGGPAEPVDRCRDPALHQAVSSRWGGRRRRPAGLAAHRVALMKPRARGEVRLVSADAAVPPAIAHHYDSEPEDLATLQLGADTARELASAATHVGDPQWSTSQHLCGTAPMGADGDEAAVLDTRCRVRGVDGLWVIDGSIMPSIPSRGPHATTVALRTAPRSSSSPVESRRLISLRAPGTRRAGRRGPGRGARPPAAARPAPAPTG